eukprot:428704_1
MPPTIDIISTQDEQSGEFNEGEVSEKRGKNYTIAITVQDCSSESCVKWLVDDMMERTDTVLNDDLNQDVAIKKTEIEGNIMTIVVTISTDLYVALETEPIAERIETELEENGYDVEVAMSETYISDIDMTVKEPAQENESIMVGIFIATVILILIAVIIYCKRLQNNKRKIQKDE